MKPVPFLLLIIAITVLLKSQSGAAEPASFDVDAVAAWLSDTFSDGDTGMVIGLLDEHGSRVLGAGQGGTEMTQEVDGDTVFEIGSVTKTFTSLLLLSMADRNELNPESPVTEYLPAAVRVPDFNGVPISLLHLAAQESGLPFNADNFTSEKRQEAYNAYTVEDLYAFLGQYGLASEPGTAFEYSNLGMSLLSHAMERAAGEDYESLVVSRICSPLDMDSTRVILNPELRVRMATGHDKDGIPVANLDMQVMQGAGALKSTANDLLKYLAAVLGFTETELQPLLDESLVVRHTGSPQYGRTAMPWYDQHAYNPPGTKLLGHGGGTFGFRSFIGFDTANRRGVVILSNQTVLHASLVGWELLQGRALSPESGHQLVREVVGIGTSLALDDESGALQITNVHAATPADRAGLIAGLIIRRVNGHVVRGKAIGECLEMMSGPVGTRIELELLDPDRQEARTVELIKQKFLITIPVAG